MEDTKPMTRQSSDPWEPNFPLRRRSQDSQASAVPEVHLLRSCCFPSQSRDHNAGDQPEPEADPDGGADRPEWFNQRFENTVKLFNAPLSEHWTRYFLVELIGTHAFCLMVRAFNYTWFLRYIVFFHHSNPGRAPLMDLQCSQMDGTCHGDVYNPLAGSTFPFKAMEFSIMTGMAYAICSMAAPGATLNPSLTLTLCLSGTRKWRILLPSIAGQFLGCLTALLVELLVVWGKIKLIQGQLMWPDRVMARFAELVFGLQYPDETVSNWVAFNFNIVNGVCIVFLMTAMNTRTESLPEMAQALGKGLAIAIFSSAFGSNGLGSMPSPSEWFAAAAMFQGLAWFYREDVWAQDIWSRHDYFALKVPLWAPFLGIILGSMLCSLYISLLFYGAGDPQHEEDSDSESELSESDLSNDGEPEGE